MAVNFNGETGETPTKGTCGTEFGLPYQKMPRGTMTLIVASDPDVCEAELLNGEVFCSSRSGVLRPWGYARLGTIRMVDGTITVCPRSARCGDCSKTSVLLPEYLLVRRVDEAAVIGSALVQSAKGIGFRKIALNIHRPETAACASWPSGRSAPWTLLTQPVCRNSCSGSFDRCD